MYTIGVDYGIGTVDFPTYVVMKNRNGKMYVLDSGLIDEFNFEKYVASERYEIVGEKEDLERFKLQFLNIK